MKRLELLIPALCMLVIGVGVVVVGSTPLDYGVELLIYDKDNWMDDLTLEQRKAKGISQEDYEIRDQRGDIIEIHEYPFYSVRDPKGWGGHAFRVVVVKGTTVAQAKALQFGARDSVGRRAKKVTSVKKAEVETVKALIDITTEMKP